MGLRTWFRGYLVRRGYRVPDALVREHDRMFHRALARTRAGMTVLDIGSNLGETATAFAARGALVHAYEPNPDVYPELLKAARDYPGITCHRAGILDENAELKLFLHQDYRSDPIKHSESSSLFSDKTNVAADHFHLVPVRDVAEVVAEIGKAIDIAKIDAEGGEYRILRRLITSGAIDRIAAIYVEPHHDRIPALRPEHAAMLALIAERGLGGKISFGWV